MFRFRCAVVVSVGVYLGLFVVLHSLSRVGILADHVALQFLLVFCPLPLIALAGSLVIVDCILRIGLHEKGLFYALGHVGLCVVLNIMGIAVVPLAVRADIERLRQLEEEEKEKRSATP